MFEVLQANETFAVVVFFVLGAIFGSFANVVIYRLPKKESVLSPGSHCRACSKPVLWYNNIPILSYFLLRGRCSHCKTPYSSRYALVEFLTAVLFAAIYLKVGLSWTLLEYLLFVFSLVVVSFIDFDHMILPDVFTLSGIVIGLVGAWLNPERDFWEAFAGFLMGGGFLWAIAYLYFLVRHEEGMGGGDIKLLAWIGAVLGWIAIPFSILFASLFGGVIGIAIMLRTKGDLKTQIPFGPYLSFAAIVYILGGDYLAQWYIHLFLPWFVPPN